MHSLTEAHNNPVIIPILQSRKLKLGELSPTAKRRRGLDSNSASQSARPSGFTLKQSDFMVIQGME
jgi:hypothetical protein